MAESEKVHREGLSYSRPGARDQDVHC
jgi:hypothetical protein